MKNSYGETALLMSYINPRTSRNFKIMELLIEFGADVFTTDAQNSTLLHYAAHMIAYDFSGASWIISMAGMDIVQKENTYGYTALDLAVIETLSMQNYYRRRENSNFDQNKRTDQILRIKQIFDPHGVLSSN